MDLVTAFSPTLTVLEAAAAAATAATATATTAVPASYPYLSYKLHIHWLVHYIVVQASPLLPLPWYVSAPGYY